MKAQGQSKSGALSTAAATRSRGATSASRATDAPRVVAQRKQFQSMFGGAIQRQGPEDEELLQGKFAPVQRETDDPDTDRDGLAPAQVQSGVERLEARLKNIRDVKPQPEAHKGSYPEVLRPDVEARLTEQLNNRRNVEPRPDVNKAPYASIAKYAEDE